VISERHGITWREGDPVMQTKNDYEREVFNGETGCINQVDPERNQMLVKVDAGTADERAITYERKHFDNVALAYACTVHKSQGSQMKAVIVIMLNEHYRMLSRALLYTALTRGEKLVVLIADPKAIAIALSETRREVRDTGLRERLRLAHGEGSDKGHEEAA
jgi:exodeoxyribonuclease V alpha subunit